jgi:hypothetical protein
MAATMVAGLSSVAMAAEVGEKTVYVQFDSSAEAYKNTDKVVINMWNAGADISKGATVKGTSAAAFASWNDKPYDMEKVSDGIYKISLNAYDDGTDQSGALVGIYEDGAADNKGLFKIENTSLVADAIKNADSKAITLVAKVDGKNWVLEVKDNYDPTAKTDDKKTDDAKTEETKTDDKKTEETKTDEKKADDTAAATEAPKADAQGTDVSPKTGDMAPIATAAVLGVVSLAGVAIALRKKAA